MPTQIEQLYSRHYDRMLLTARTLLDNDEDARDAVSDVFTELLASGKQLDELRAESYLLVSVRNRCMNMLEHRQVVEASEKLLTPDDETSNYEEPPLDQVLDYMDTRLTELLPAALGLKNGDAKIIKNAGGLVISAFDSAMRSLIVAIYELGVQEIMVVAHSHCGACHMSYDHFHHEMIARGVADETLDTIRKCGIDLNAWLEGFKDTPTSVRRTVETILTHPLVPKDIVVRGFIIDSETGELEEIK